MKELTKPAIGEPCNGCGLCCKVQVCRNGAYVLGLVDILGDTVPGPCPALISKNDGSFTCGVVDNPHKYIKNRKNYTAKALSNNFKILIGAGTGCDELFENDTEEEEAKLDKIMEAKKNNPTWISNARRAIKVIHNIG